MVGRCVLGLEMIWSARTGLCMQIMNSCYCSECWPNFFTLIVLLVTNTVINDDNAMFFKAGMYIVFRHQTCSVSILGD